MPAPEPRVMPRQSLQLALGQSKIGYTFASPEGLPITHAGVDYSYEGFDARGGSSQKTLQLPAGGRTFKFYTSCIVYEVQVYVNPPELRVQSVSYEAATNSIRYALNGAPESIRISYDIMGCHPDASYCSGNMVYPTGAASGVIALDPLFPEIDDYFAQYDASGVQLTLLPYRPDAETVNVGTVTFSL